MAKKKILVIEDEPSVLDNILELLDNDEFEVRGASNGKMGVEKALDFIPDLIISDIIMPELDGFGVLKELQKSEKTSSIPFIFLTAKAELSDIRNGMTLGADDYLTKPFLPNELYDAIHTRFSKFEKISYKSEEKLQDLRLKIASTVPHELRTPLNSIMASSQILIDYYDSMDDDEIKQLHQNIYDSSKRLHELVSRYLFYSNIELLYYNEERRKLIKDASVLFNSAEVTQKSLNYLAREQKRDSDLVFDLVDFNLNMLIEHYQNICTELMVNALKFSAPGTKIEVSTFLDDNHFILSIKDYGRGMSEEQMNNIGAYIQFDRKIYEQQGSGLGLIITKRISQIYNGRLEIESKTGSFTKISVYLPQV